MPPTAAGLAVWLGLAGVVGCGPVAVGQPSQRPESRQPEGIQIHRDLEYGTGGGRPLHLHLMKPAEPTDQPRPVIVWVHGGGWRAGHHDSGLRRLVPFVRRGYVGASIEYRLSDEAEFPAQIEDCKAAIRYLRTHTEKYQIDPNRIGVWGSSAGGHLSALLGTSGGVADLEGQGDWPEVSSRVQAVCDFYGPTDFLRMNDHPGRIDHDAPGSPESQLIGGPIQDHPDRVARANPITYVSPDDPPFLIVHGDRDPLVPPHQSQLLHDALSRADVPVSLIVVKDAGHGWNNRPKVDQAVADFFDQTLRSADPESERRCPEASASPSGRR